MCSSFDWIIEIILFVVYMKTDADYCIKNSIGLNCNHNCNYNDCSDGMYSQVYQKKHVQDSDKMNPTVLCSASSKYFFHLCDQLRHLLRLKLSYHEIRWAGWYGMLPEFGMHTIHHMTAYQQFLDVWDLKWLLKSYPNLYSSVPNCITSCIFIEFLLYVIICLD